MILLDRRAAAFAGKTRSRHAAAADHSQLTQACRFRARGQHVGSTTRSIPRLPRMYGDSARLVAEYHRPS